MAPIRVGIIGITAQAGKMGVGGWGVAAHLASLASSPHYEIVALCNSSVKNAERAIAFHKLPSTVKAYGKAEDLAADPDVDLISISVVVYKHLLVAKPALLAKKQVFVEWPLGASSEEAEEMVRLAKEAGLKTVVGAQFQADPWIAKIKELVDGGAIGKVLSSEAMISPSMGPLASWMAEAAYYLDFKSGGNEYHIGFGHFMAAFIHVLGDFETVKSTFAIHQPFVKLVNGAGEVVDEKYQKTAPDHIWSQGRLKSGAVASVSLRRTPKPVDGKTLRWLISGTEGELELLTSGPGLQMGGSDKSIRIRTQDDKGEARVVEWEVEEPEHIKNVAFPGKNTARLFEAFALKKDEVFGDFEGGLRLHRLLDRIAKDAGFQ